MTWVNLNDVYVKKTGGTINGDLDVTGAITVNDGSGNGTKYDVANEISTLRDSVSQNTSDIGKNASSIKTNASSISSLSSTVSQIMSKIYPVGSIYTSTRSTNPKTLFGFGTWEQIKDRFLLAAGSTYTAGKTGGEAAHKLTIAEMPSHNHTSGIRLQWYNETNTGMSYAYSSNTNVGVDRATTMTGNTGGGSAHNNMPPYIVVYVWKRTA